jgi:hypothetical protein
MKGNEWKMALGAVVLLVVVLVIGKTMQGGPTEEGKVSSNGCSPENYKNQARPIMQEFQEYIQTIDLDDPNSLSAAEIELQDLLDEAENVNCAYKYPLKQETLEYSIIHMLDVVKYAKEGELVEMQHAINRVELNVETFYDWSVDMGE